MKSIFNFILFLTIVQISWAQNCDFGIRILSNKLNGNSELIDKSEYEKVIGISERYIEFKPSSEFELTEKYPKIFKYKDSCYSFKANIDIRIGIRTAELKACKYLLKGKENSNYEFKGTYFGNALIRITGYEFWGFLSVDLENGLTCFTMGKPLTSNGETAISHSNYYGEEEIALTDLKTKKQYVIGIEGYRTTESITFENSYYLKLTSKLHSSCEKNIKYLKVEIKN